MDNVHPDQRLAAILDPSERLLWSGQPVPQYQATARTGGPWVLALTVLVASLVLSVVLSLLFHSFCLVTLLVLPVLPFLRRSSAQRYALTNRRAIIGGGGQQVQSFSAGQVVAIERRDHDDGTGDVLFATLDGSGIGAMPGFYGIADAPRIEHLAQDVLLMRENAQ